MKIAFVGLGKMGLPMATRLAAAGHDVVAHDASATRRAMGVEQRLRVMDRIEDVTRGCDAVLSSLPHDAALLSVAEQLRACVAPGAVWADTSTVSLEASARAASLLDESGIECLRAPVSGNATMAEAGTLTLMISGPLAAHERLQHLWPALGPKQFYVGPADEARLLKLVVNLLIAQTSAMLAEALTLGRKGGLEWSTLWAVIADSAVGSPIVRAKAPLLARRDFTPTFTVTQMRKDLRLIQGAAASYKLPLPMCDHVDRLLESASAAGWADEDYAAIIRVVERSAGLGEPGSVPGGESP